jgi:hypothetical protein
MRWGDIIMAAAEHGGFRPNKIAYSPIDRAYGTHRFDHLLSSPDIAGLIGGGLKTDQYRRLGLGSQRAVAFDTHAARIAGLQKYFADEVAKEGLTGEKGWEEAHKRMNDFAARESSYAAGAAYNRAGGESMGVPGHVWQAATWGPQRALADVLAQNDFDPVKSAHALTHRDVFYAGSFLPVAASADMQHRIKTMEQEGLIDRGAHKAIRDWLRSEWPSEELLNTTVGGPQLVPHAKEVLRNLTRNFSVNFGKAANTVRMHYHTPEEDRTARPFRKPLMARIINTRRLVDRLVSSYPKDFNAR